jgi:Fe(3+) dicitrate transport protein
LRKLLILLLWIFAPRNNKMKHIITAVALLVSTVSFSQNQQTPPTDTPVHRYLSEITVVGRSSKSDYHQLPEIVGTNIYAGKKNALIVLDNVQGNVSTNTMRQVLAKIPGIHVWESDPSGIQIGIAARGLSPNRSWEFNVRQNGYDISADPFGYPEAYYNPQLQAVQRIEVVRGQGSLQYGAQFGGLVNYILRNGSEINKTFEFETQQTMGSNSLFNTFNAVGGKTERVHYYAFFDHRNGDGWRANSKFFTNAGFGTFTFYVTPRFSLTAEMMRSHIRSQQAGGLTDKQFNEDPQQSFRSRNWFDITWTNPALIANFQISPTTKWNTKLFATIGDRNSVGFTQSLVNSAGNFVRDSFVVSKNRFGDRVLNIDKYRNYAIESRILTDYKLFGMDNSFSGGIRLYTGSTHRLADARDESGRSDYLTTPSTKWARDITFNSRNAAAFVENIFRVSDKVLIIPGARFEWLEGSANGRDKFNADSTESILQNIKRSRTFILAGIGAEYHVTKTTEFYASAAQAYRPIQFANLQAPPTTNIVDPELKDAKGYNVDLGYRGKIKDFLTFDVSGYYLQYNNRVGNIPVIDSSTTPATTRTMVTNVGASTSKGFEGYVEFNPVRAFVKDYTHADVIIFGSYSYTDARYSSNHLDAKTKGKPVENAPKNIFRGGISAGYKNFLVTGQYSYVGSTYSDAVNTEFQANGQNGLIPSYDVMDLTLSYKLPRGFNIKAGINNLLDENYFTRRAGGYPGPGVLPADGRTFFVSLGAKF